MTPLDMTAPLDDRPVASPGPLQAGLAPLTRIAGGPAAAHALPRQS